MTSCVLCPLQKYIVLKNIRITQNILAYSCIQFLRYNTLSIMFKIIIMYPIISNLICLVFYYNIFINSLHQSKIPKHSLMFALFPYSFCIRSPHFCWVYVTNGFILNEQNYVLFSNAINSCTHLLTLVLGCRTDMLRILKTKQNHYLLKY